VGARNIFLPFRIPLTYNLPRKLQWYWTYLSLSVVPVQPVQKEIKGYFLIIFKNLIALLTIKRKFQEYLLAVFLIYR